MPPGGVHPIAHTPSPDQCRRRKAASACQPRANETKRPCRYTNPCSAPTPPAPPSPFLKLMGRVETITSTRLEGSIVMTSRAFTRSWQFLQPSWQFPAGSSLRPPRSLWMDSKTGAYDLLGRTESAGTGGGVPSDSTRGAKQETSSSMADRPSFPPRARPRHFRQMVRTKSIARRAASTTSLADSRRSLLGPCLVISGSGKVLDPQ